MLIPLLCVLVLFIDTSVGVFRDVSHRILQNPSVCRSGSAVVDTNGDGQFEAFFTGCVGSANQLLVFDHQSHRMMDGAATNQGVKAVASPGQAACGCDVDDDGTDEIYVLNNDMFGGNRSDTVADALYKNVDGRWFNLFDQSLFPQNYDRRNRWAGRAVGCMYSQILRRYAALVPSSVVPTAAFSELRDPTKPSRDTQASTLDPSMKLFTLFGKDVHDAAQDEGFTHSLSSRGLAIGPIVQKPGEALQGSDVLVANDRGLNKVFVHAEEELPHTAMEPHAIADPFQTTRAVAIADFDGDGLSDIVMGAWNGNIQVLHQYMEHEDHMFEDVTQGTPLGDRMAVRNLAVADFDNDGWLEIFVALAPHGGRPAGNRLFKVFPKPSRDGEHQTLGFREMDTGDASEPDTWTTAVTVGDFNLDGRLELMLGSGDATAGPIRYLELAEPGEYHWLRVLPLAVGGGPARGADVTIKQGDDQEGVHVQRRIIDGGSGYAAQQEPVAHFGLGEDARSPVEVTVRWPDGQMSVDRVDIDTLVMIEHPAMEDANSTIETPHDLHTAPRSPPANASRLPAPKSGSAALLGAMMGHRRPASAVNASAGSKTLNGSARPNASLPTEKSKFRGSSDLLKGLLSRGSSQKGQPTAHQRHAGAELDQNAHTGGAPDSGAMPPANGTARMLPPGLQSIINRANGG